MLKMAIGHVVHEVNCSLLLCNQKQIRAESEYVTEATSSVTVPEFFRGCKYYFFHSDGQNINFFIVLLSCLAVLYDAH